MSPVTRVTLVLPHKLWERVKNTVPSGKRSGFVAEAIEHELRRRSRSNQFKKLTQFHQRMKDKYGILPSSAKGVEQIRQERDLEQNHLR